MGRTIVAIGGGSLSTDRSRPTLEDYILSLPGKDRPGVCFIPTASGDSAALIDEFYKVFDSGRCRPSHLSLFDRSVRGLRSQLLDQDIVYVGGGNTANMVALWRLHGLDAALHAAWQEGVVLSGSSAGASCWHEASLVDSFGPLTTWHDGLGLIKGSFCPHYRSDPGRRPLFLDSIRNGALPTGLGVDEDVAVRYEDERVAEVVSVRNDALAWRIEKAGDAVSEVEIRPRLLTVG